MALEHAVISGAQIVITLIVAPLGKIAIAANAFAVTAESLCYMPGFGIGDAATTLVGQSYGARRFDLVRRLGYVTVGMGMAVMTIMGAILYVTAPYVMGMLSPVREICDLGTEVLRIEAWAEPMYAAQTIGLKGVWLAMCIELTFRGVIFLVRLLRGSWLRHGVKSAPEPVNPLPVNDN